MLEYLDKIDLHEFDSDHPYYVVAEEGFLEGENVTQAELVQLMYQKGEEGYDIGDPYPVKRNNSGKLVKAEVETHYSRDSVTTGAYGYTKTHSWVDEELDESDVDFWLTELDDYDYDFNPFDVIGITEENYQPTSNFIIVSIDSDKCEVGKWFEEYKKDKPQ